MEEKTVLKGTQAIRLVIATPFYENRGFSGYISCLVKTISLLQKLEVEYDYWELSGDSYIDRARNAIANKFMNSDYTHLLFIDSDQTWDLEGFGRMLTADVDVVGAGYPCKNNWDFFSCILKDSPDGRPIVNEKGLIAATGVPSGFILIRRQVFKILAEKMPGNFYVGRDSVTKEEVKHFNFYGRIPPMGEDISFCHRWMTCGGELWVEPRVKMGHYGTTLHTGEYHEYLMACPGGVNGPPLEKDETGK